MALSVSRRTLLEKLVRGNMSINDMGSVHGFNRRTVRKYYPDYRLPGSPEAFTTELTQNRKEELAELVRQGKSLAEIERVFGFNYQTVRKYYPDYRTRAKSIREDHHNLPEETVQRLHEMVNDRVPMKEIMETLNLTRNQVLWQDQNAAWTREESGEWSQAVQKARAMGIWM